ncbi:hypothetical protein CLV24_11197 [Pontibacter ummariensis]|uniref:Uncharacterized protein n=1 Tax=Pontibacter ummariensis TaxID=1610492 RepID=A0A239GJF5_9BACT|nr:hypothetical protein [Pontibacter ummariensis]PRY11302.1 hypothetical protein CLV24_11197 [Pontibacter ummariensis]SNS69297.1 hypothetical protein SAMN06296052_11197 [Pontibacter ummariensis]
MEGKDSKSQSKQHILSQEQEALLDLYIQKLDDYFEGLKASEKVQVEVETLHLKKILTK